MAALDFPNAPTVGQVYQGYTWTGVVWLAPGLSPILNSFAALSGAVAAGDLFMGVAPGVVARLPASPSAPGGKLSVLTMDSNGVLSWSTGTRRFVEKRYFTPFSHAYTRTPGCTRGDIHTCGGQGGTTGWAAAPGWLFITGSGGCGAICHAFDQLLPDTADAFVGNGAQSSGGPNFTTNAQASTFNGIYSANGGGNGGAASTNASTMVAGPGGAGGNTVGVTTGPNIENWAGNTGMYGTASNAFYALPPATYVEFMGALLRSGPGNAGQGATAMASLPGQPGGVVIREYYD